MRGATSTRLRGRGAIPMRVPLPRHRPRARRVLLRGPPGWGEFVAVPASTTTPSASPLAGRRASRPAGRGLARPGARRRCPVNATVPGGRGPTQVAEVLARFAGCTTAKVKVAEPGQSLADDVARVAAVRDVLGADRPGAGRRQRRLDGRRRAVRAASRLLGRCGLEYVEQPCAHASRSCALRVRCARRRRADRRRRVDPQGRGPAAGGAGCGAADIVVRQGRAARRGRGRRCAIAEQLRAAGRRLVGASTPRSASRPGVALAAALPELPYACGLATVALLAGDVVAPRRSTAHGGGSSGRRGRAGDDELLERLAAPPDRQPWWRDRLAPVLRPPPSPANLGVRQDVNRPGRRQLGAQNPQVCGKAAGRAREIVRLQSTDRQPMKRGMPARIPSVGTQRFHLGLCECSSTLSGRMDDVGLSTQTSSQIKFGSCGFFRQSGVNALSPTTITATYLIGDDIMIASFFATLRQYPEIAIFLSLGLGLLSSADPVQGHGPRRGHGDTDRRGDHRPTGDHGRPDRSSRRSS